MKRHGLLFTPRDALAYINFTFTPTKPIACRKENILRQSTHSVVCTHPYGFLLKVMRIKVK